MGQKVHPHGMRVGVIKNWSSKWYADSKDFAKFVVEDNKIRKELKKELYQARISDMIIERTNSEVRVTLHTAKPGLVIGKNGAQLEELKKKLQKELGREISINVVEIRKPDLDSQVVAETVAASLEKRMSFRKAMKQAIQKTRKAGAKGIKIAVSGRLGGAEMARTEFYSEGTVPLQTIRADIDYGFAEADTTYGKLGVKVLIYKGEILGNKKERLYGKRKNEPRRDNRNNNKRNNNTKKVNKGEKEVSENAINAKEN
ncbi:MAG: 30S ribosomal protein S3 [Clostridiales bacterium]|nr:30S ribosomal protein S3 [Clostridiales bacterium]